MQDIVPLASTAEDKSTADMAIHMQGQFPPIIYYFRKDLVAHQAGIEARDLFLIVSVNDN